MEVFHSTNMLHYMQLPFVGELYAFLGRRLHVYLLLAEVILRTFLLEVMQLFHVVVRQEQLCNIQACSEVVAMSHMPHLNKQIQNCGRQFPNKKINK